MLLSLKLSASHQKLLRLILFRLRDLSLFRNPLLLSRYFSLFPVLFEYLLTLDFLPLHLLSPHFNFVSLLFSDAFRLLNKSLLSSFSLCLFLFNLLLTNQLILRSLSSC